uniref:Uncharacterized protein n=1 Tax=Arion vulgaris TaxID=1028688 RepID=A0A0B6YKW0_9EUPU
MEKKQTTASMTLAGDSFIAVKKLSSCARKIRFVSAHAKIYMHSSDNDRMNK